MEKIDKNRQKGRKFVENEEEKWYNRCITDVYTKKKGLKRKGNHATVSVNDDG